MSEHVKVIEEVLPVECMDGQCEHAARDEDCPPQAVEVCSECREEYEDGDMVLLTPWATAEASGHRVSASEGQPAPPADSDTHWANGEPRLLTPEAFERLSASRQPAQTDNEGDER